MQVPPPPVGAHARERFWAVFSQICTAIFLTGRLPAVWETRVRMTKQSTEVKHETSRLWSGGLKLRHRLDECLRTTKRYLMATYTCRSIVQLTTFAISTMSHRNSPLCVAVAY